MFYTESKQECFGPIPHLHCLQTQLHSEILKPSGDPFDLLRVMIATEIVYAGTIGWRMCLWK